MKEEQFIRNQIQKILSERGRRRSGNRSTGVRRVPLERGALASSDPEALVSKLGIRSASGRTTEQKVLSVLSAAIDKLKSTEGLEGAFQDASLDDGYIVIEKGDISSGEAQTYINHILIAAESAGVLSGLDKPVIVSQKDREVVVLFESE